MTESKEQKPVEEGCCADQQCQCEKDAKCECNSATAEGEAPTREMSAEELQTALKMAEAKVLEHYDLYVRAMAELENTRRRALMMFRKLASLGLKNLQKTFCQLSIVWRRLLRRLRIYRILRFAKGWKQLIAR